MLSRKHKLFFKREFYVALIGLLLGLWVWLSLFRVVYITDELEDSYALVLLTEPKAGDLVVYTYPNLTSPLRVSTLNSKSQTGDLTVDLGGEREEPIDEDLVVGVVIFQRSL